MSVLSLADQQRSIILAQEASAGTQIASQWQAAFARILAGLRALFAAMQSAEQRGETVNLAWLYQSLRLQQALHLIEGEMQTFSQQSSLVVQGQVVQAQQSGRQDGQALVQQAQPGISANQSLMTSLDISQSTSRFAMMPADATARAKSTLLDGAANGKGPSQIASRLQLVLAMSLGVALCVSRTEAMDAYRDGSLAVYQANSETVTGWRWLAEPGACPDCESMNGSTHPLDEPMDEHPNGRCVPLPITKNGADNEQ